MFPGCSKRDSKPYGWPIHSFAESLVPWQPLRSRSRWRGIAVCNDLSWALQVGIVPVCKLLLFSATCCHC